MTGDRMNAQDTPTSQGTELSPVGAGDSPLGFSLGADPDTVKTKATNQRAELTRAANKVRADMDAQRADMETKRRELQAEMNRQLAELDAQRRELEATLAPLVEKAAQLKEIVWTVNLYLGEDEDLTVIRDGKPAPANTPITIRQQVLVMSEEALVLIGDGGTGVDYTSIGVFVDWMNADPANVDQLLPEQKCVVVMVPTRVKSSASNMFQADAEDMANRRAHWLIRNGERVTLLQTDPELEVGDRILPKRSEFVEFFNRRPFGSRRAAGEPMVPGSDEWVEAEKGADAHRRHFMRLMLVLQGLLSRSPALAPLPDGGVNLLSLSAQDEGKVVIVNEVDNIISDGRESFQAWQKRLNGELRVGHRVIGNWGASEFRRLDYDDRSWSGIGNPRLHPASAPTPDANVLHTIEDRRDGGYVIRYQRTDKVYKRNAPVPGRPGYYYRGESQVEATQRASCVIQRGDSWVLPFDLVTVPELTYYLRSREARTEFLTMVPVVKAAIAAKRAEAEIEAPFRALIGHLLVDAGADPDTIDTTVADLVHWWKVAHVHGRALNGEPEHEAKAARQIVAEYKSRTRAARDDSGAMVTVGRTVPDVIAVARTRAGKWFAYAPSTPAHDQGVFLDATPIAKDGTLGTVEHEKVLAHRTVAALHVAWSTDVWDTWVHTATRRYYLTVAERDAIIATARERAEGTPLAVTEYFDPKKPAERYMGVYAWTTACAPETAPNDRGSDPLNWRTEQTVRLVNVTTWKIERDDIGVRLVPSGGRGRLPSYFGTYSGKTGWLVDVPWYPEDAERFSNIRPRLVWENTAMRDRVADYVASCRTVADTERAREDAARAEATRYVGPTLKLIRAAQDDTAHEKFRDDFGTNAEDLWPPHLTSLKLREPVAQNDVWTLVHHAQQQGEPVVGRTLADLVKLYGTTAPVDTWRCRNTPTINPDYAHIVIPEPPEDTP